MRKKNLVTTVLVASMLVGSLGVTSTPAEAKSKIKLSTTRVSLNEGESKTIKIRGTKKKVKWSVVRGNKNIKLKSKRRTSVKVVALKKGTAKVQAKLGKKKYICRVTVKKVTPAKTITITTADAQTAKVVHDALNTGEAVNIMIKGSKFTAGAIMDKLDEVVGKYNGYGVVPQLASGKASSTSGYRVFTSSAYNSKLYKYGVLLAADIVDNLKWGYEEELKEQNKTIKSEEDRLKTQYAVGSDDYKKIFYETTGISYDDYKDGQTAKPKQQTLYYDDSCFGELDNSWSLPQDYYYATYTVNGKQYTSIGELGWVADWTRIGQIYDEEADMYVDDPSTLNNPSNYYINHTTNDGVKSRVYFDDITFHYEPLTVDTAKVESVINSKIQSELETFKKEKGYNGYVEPILNTPFTELSQAYQMYYICKAFGKVGVGIRDKDDWTSYANVKAASMGSKRHRGMKNPKGRVDAGDGLSGVKAMLDHKWMGVCSDYASMEITMYELFGISDTAYISCNKCDHAWTAVEVTNSRGERAWLRNDYGTLKLGYKTVPYCKKHCGRAERIDDFVN